MYFQEYLEVMGFSGRPESRVLKVIACDFIFYIVIVFMKLFRKGSWGVTTLKSFCLRYLTFIL